MAGSVLAGLAHLLTANDKNPTTSYSLGIIHTAKTFEMVFGNLMITLASDGLAKGMKAPKSGKRAEKKKRDATVPPTSGQTTPETTGLQGQRRDRKIATFY